jgi:hypothetical protein
MGVNRFVWIATAALTAAGFVALQPPTLDLLLVNGTATSPRWATC